MVLRAFNFGGSIQLPGDVDANVQIVSAFVTSVDRYAGLYIECNSPSAAVAFMKPAYYTLRSVALVPIEERCSLLTVAMENHKWTRLRDGSLAYILGCEHDGNKNVYAIAAPPILPPLGNPSGKKARRLYTYEDLIPLLARLDRPIIGFLNYGTHAMNFVNQSASREFIGPLDVSYLSEVKIQPVENPDPYDLCLFVQANNYWPILLHSLRNHEGLNANTISVSHDLDFLTPDTMEKIAKRFALSSLTAGDRVEVSGDADIAPDNRKGVVISVDANEVTVEFYSNRQRGTVLKKSTRQYFESLDLVEAVSGPYKGIRSVVLCCTGDNVTIAKEDNTADIVRAHTH